MYPFFKFFYKKSNSSPTYRKPTTSCYLFVKLDRVKRKKLTKTYLYDINKLSNRDAPSLRLDFFHTKRRAHGSFLFYGLGLNKKYC